MQSPYTNTLLSLTIEVGVGIAGYMGSRTKVQELNLGAIVHPDRIDEDVLVLDISVNDSTLMTSQDCRDNLS